MLLKLIPSLKDNKIIYWIDKILCSPFYIGFVAILVALAEIFSIEFVVFYILIVFSVVVPSLLCHDMTPFIPAIIMFYASMSIKTLDQEKSVLLGNNLPHFIIMFSLLMIFGIGKLVFDLIVYKERRTHYPRFLIGYGAILLAFTLGGLFSPFYEFKTVLFGLREFSALAGLYFYLLYTIDWKTFNKAYFAWVFALFGVVLCAEILNCVFQDITVRTGWGVTNNIAGSLAMCFGGVGYLAIKKKPYVAWIFSLLIFVFLTCVGLTSSRGGTVAAIIMMITCVILIMIFSNRYTRIVTGTLTIAFIATFLILFIFETDFMMKYFGRALGSGVDFDNLDEFSSHRLRDWKIGLEHWASYPVFGVGWFQCTWREHGWPAVYHNTYVQFMATGGTFGILAYLFHRFETILAGFKKPALEKTFAFVCIYGLLAANFFDCHFFNIWPAFGYAGLLAFIEGRNIKKGIVC